jgi:acyl carrier protein
MEKAEIQTRLIEILAKHTSIEPSALAPDKNLKLDLGLDSLDVAEIVYEIEEVFDISISDDSADKVQKICDMVDFIAEKMRSAAEGSLSPQER